MDLLDRQNRLHYRGRKIYDDDGTEILNYYFNTWYDRERFENWFPCPYKDPEREELEDLGTRQVVMEWFMDPTNQRWNHESDLYFYKVNRERALKKNKKKTLQLHKERINIKFKHCLLIKVTNNRIECYKIED